MAMNRRFRRRLLLTLRDFLLGFYGRQAWIHLKAKDWFMLSKQKWKTSATSKRTRWKFSLEETTRQASTHGSFHGVTEPPKSGLPQKRETQRNFCRVWCISIPWLRSTSQGRVLR